MKRYTLWFLPATGIIFLGLLTPVPAARTDQAHLNVQMAYGLEEGSDINAIVS